LLWNEKYNNRAMPWKGETDAYKIWLSEVILQQTRVEQGWEYYNRFVAKFPTINQLAHASDQEVFKLWEGLGYYSRCRNLLLTARKITYEFAGKFPQNHHEIIALPGIGPYTAAAISSFAFNLPFAVVDGNVIRVLARYFGIYADPTTGTGKKEFASLAQDLLDKQLPGIYNQAIMDFGATICKPQSPLCDQCLLRRKCIAFQEDQVGQLPVKSLKKPKKQRWFHYFIQNEANTVLIRKRLGRDIWQNLHEFPMLETNAAMDFLEIAKLPGIFHSCTQKNLLYESPIYRQELTHQTIHARFYIMEDITPALAGEYMRVPISELRHYAFPVVINRFMTAREYPGLHLIP
jgi:A/G-specific adenine glycosylase